MSKHIKIQDRIIGEGSPTYMIAEMSANHAGDKEKAKKIIRKAKETGADCIKIQTYTPDTMTLDSKKDYFKIQNGAWEGKTLYELYEEAYTPWEWHKELKKEAQRVGIDFFSTPYEQTAVDFLEKLGVNFYKIASFSITNLPFLKYVASKGKPIIMSTGMATLGEIEEAMSTIRAQGNEQLALLHCSSAYPAKPEEMYLQTIKHLKETFTVPVGLSDHTLGTTSAISSVAMGANLIEKHFCLSREIQTPDSDFSMEPHEFKRMVNKVRKAEKARKGIHYGISEMEKKSRIFRRSIFVVEDIKEGESFSQSNIRIIRPAHGLPPKHFHSILGKKAARKIEQGTPLKWEMVVE